MADDKLIIRVVIVREGSKEFDFQKVKISKCENCQKLITLFREENQLAGLWKI